MAAAFSSLVGCVMAARFEDIQPGDQVEMPAKRGMMYDAERDARDPMRPINCAVVTHRWHDPYEGKEYVCICRILRSGEIGKPLAKHTIKGLAQAGWIPARRDWLIYAKSLQAGEVVPIRRRKA